MAYWVTLAKGSSLEEFQASAGQSPYSELPKGTLAELIIETPWWAPIAPLADLIGAEWVADKFLNEAGMEITDVEGKGFYKIVVHMKADIGWVLAAVIVIAAVCGVAGLVIAYMILKALVEVAPPGAIWLIAVALVVAAAAGLAKLVKKKAPT